MSKPRKAKHANDEWMTPPEIIKRVRQVLGQIDQDPASSALANETVQAVAYYTKETDGLVCRWVGETFYLNPPYSFPLIEKFVDRAISGVRGRSRQGIVLVNNSTDTAWFQALLASANYIHLFRGRISFIDPVKGRGTENRQGQAIFGLGLDKARGRRFLEVFGEPKGYGWTMEIR